MRKLSSMLGCPVVKISRLNELEKLIKQIELNDTIKNSYLFVTLEAKN